MAELSIRHEVKGTVDQVCSRVEEVAQKAGFGILTRIEFDRKIQEKLGKTLPRTVILGACNPALAHAAYLQTTDVALLIPCNIVVREGEAGRVVIEAMRPTKMLEFLPAVKKDPAIDEAEKRLADAIRSL